MMRGIFVTAALLAATVAAPVAQADFHGACRPSGNAGVSLSQSEGTFTFSGQVTCGTAARIDIKSLRLLRADGGTEVASAAPASCGPCDALSAVGTAPAAAGTYVVAMTFDVVVAGTTFSNRRRSATYEWDGSGQPTRLGSPVAPSLANRCDPAGGATVGFAPDPFPAQSAVYSGTVSCASATGMSVEARVRRPDGTTVRSPVVSCSVDCTAPLTASASTSTTRPGDHLVTVSYSVDVAGLTITGSVSGTWLWLGAGPAVRR